jgi:formate dehydrogenase major subunit
MGVGALGLVDRGFDTVVKPTLQKPLAESGCTSCGQCVSVCPTGALQERLSLPKSIPLETVETDTTCPYCSIGCSLTLETYGDLLVKSTPDKDGAVNKGLLCGKGKFGFDCAELDGKLLEPLLRTTDGSTLAEADYYDAFVMTAKKAESIAARYGRDAVAVAISDRYTNEEVYAIRQLAEEIGARTISFNNRRNGLTRVLGVDASPNTIDELLSTNVILTVAVNAQENPVLQIKLKQAVEAGAQVIVIGPKDLTESPKFASQIINPANNLKFLKEIAAAIIASGAAKEASGLDEFKKSLEGVKPSKKAEEIAALYTGAKKAMVVYQQNTVTEDAATLLADIAVLSGHIGTPRDGILQVRPKNNSQGLADQGVRGTAEDLDGVKALLIFGEDPIGAAEANPAAPEAKAALKAFKNAEFTMVCDTHLTETAEAADVVIPGTGFASTDGTFTNTERRLQLVQEAVVEDVSYSNWEVAREIAHIYEVEFPWEDTADISTEMEDELPIYRYTEVDEIFGGVLVTPDPILIPVDDGKLVNKLAPTDNLMNMIQERLPEVAPMPTQA